MSETKTLNQKIEELDKTADWFYSDEFSLDKAVPKYKEAVALAKEMGVTVCDCYSQWKELAKTQDTTMLLANRINHPTREMHELFAESLFRTIFGVDTDMVAGNVSTMYQKD